MVRYAGAYLLFWEVCAGWLRLCVLRRFQKEAWVGSFFLVLVGTYEQKTLRTCLAEDSPVLFRCAVGVSELSAASVYCHALWGWETSSTCRAQVFSCAYVFQCGLMQWSVGDFRWVLYVMLHTFHWGQY